MLDAHLRLRLVDARARLGRGLEVNDLDELLSESTAEIEELADISRITEEMLAGLVPLLLAVESVLDSAEPAVRAVFREVVTTLRDHGVIVEKPATAERVSESAPTAPTHRGRMWLKCSRATLLLKRVDSFSSVTTNMFFVT